MEGEKWIKTADALIAFVKATAQHDRVWITFFETAYRDFAEKPVERDALLQDPNFQSLAKLGTGGGTELLPALCHVLEILQRFSAARRSHIILITDGQVANEEAVLKEVSGKALPVHCFGIEHAVNEAFLRQLSAAGNQRFSDPERQSCSSYCHPWLKAEPSGFHAPDPGRRLGIGRHRIAGHLCRPSGLRSYPNEGQRVGLQGCRQRQRWAPVECPASCAGYENRFAKAYLDETPH
jgi:hypothetical protein